MSQTMTIDDIWKLFQETNRMFQESKEKSDRDIEETRRILRESSAKAELDIEETRRILREYSAEADLRFKETDREFKEIALGFKETERVVKEVSRQIGQLGSRWGEFVEGLIAPACINLFTRRGIPVDEVFPRVRKKLGDQHMEIDLLVANTVAAVLVEVKSNLKVEDVRNHLERLNQFKSFFPRYADCTVYGAVAGIVIDADADQFAMNKGLFVIVQSGETVKLANDEHFTPKTW